MRQDLKLPKGKACAQSAHASVEAVLKSNSLKVKAWRRQGMPKIVLKVENEEQLVGYYQKAKDFGLTTVLVADAGRTVVIPGTKTCAAIGPEKADLIDKVTKNLPLL